MMQRSGWLLGVLLVAVALLAWGVGGCGGGATTATVPTGNSIAGTTTATAGGAAGGSAGNGAELQPVLIGFKSSPGPAEQALIRAHSGKVKYAYHLIPVLAVSLPPQAIEALSKNPRIEYIEPDSTAQATEDSIPWGISRVRADQVWELGNSGAGVKIAVIDTGIDYHHPDLAPNYKGGYDFVNDDEDPMDDNGHGTHCAGIAAAARDGAGVAGVAPGASLYALKVLDGTGSGYYSDIIAALQWAADNGMQVASMSLGGTARSRALASACDAAYGAGVVLVAAAGNNGNARGTGNSVEYPAKYDSVIAVAATDENDERAPWSATGSAVELAAPGVNIVSDKLGGGTVAESGTSMACPHVSGVAALVIASGVSTASAVRQRLDSTAVDLGPAGVDKWFGHGLVDALAAVSGSSPPPPPPAPGETGAIAGKVTDAATGRAIGGATVSVDSGQSGTTNRGGRYKVTDIPAGEHSVTASAPGYAAVTKTVTVTADQTSTVHFALSAQ